ncbi:hypothetical protein H5410_021728 [Solanum commersonii]|uniref:Uncharacterized protein n=1 Tax=Solanum commersonii TaxID=4109 RepID=A0A9J5ZES2_SOLCO|nr:hypothetical protein H5410_021728 [Solanum commersonii]
MKNSQNHLVPVELISRVTQIQIWLAKGWKEFCDYYSISIRNFLIVRYNTRAHFDYYIALEYLFQEISEGSEEHEQQPNIGTDQEVGEANTRSEEVGPKNSSQHNFVNLNGGNPYFEIVMKKKIHTTSIVRFNNEYILFSHLLDFSFLYTILIRFALRTNIVNMKNMCLLKQEGIEWGVEIQYNGHMIASDETCRFKLIRAHVANVLQILDRFIFIYFKTTGKCAIQLLGMESPNKAQISVKNMLEDEQPSGLNKDKQKKKTTTRG